MTRTRRAVAAREVVAMPHAPAKRRLVAYAPDPDGADSGQAEAVRVLVVEDEYLVAVQIEAALTDAGFQVVGIAATAEEAIAIAARKHPAIAVVDIRLAGEMDGVDAAVIMHREHGVRSIFATAHHDPATRARAAAAMPLGWLPKPYLMDTLIKAVEKAAGQDH